MNTENWKQVMRETEPVALFKNQEDAAAFVAQSNGNAAAIIDRNEHWTGRVMAGFVIGAMLGTLLGIWAK